MGLDLSNGSCPDCFPLVILKNCKPELSYILSEFFKLSEGVLFSSCWKVSLVVPVLKNGEHSATKNCHLASLLSVVSKVFEKLVNNIVNHL